MVSLKCELSDRQIKAEFRKLIFGQRVFCPHCGFTKIRSSEGRYWCKKCRRHFSLTSGTWLSGMKISWTKMYIVLECWLRKIDIGNVCHLTGTSYPTVFYFYRKFRQHVPENAFKIGANGHYLVDESYFGWKRKGQRGRGAQGRVPVMGVYHDGLIKTKVIPDVSPGSLLPVIQSNVPRGSQITSDKWRSYNRLKSLGYRHKRINHEYRYLETNPIEAAWSQMKRSLERMYHHCHLKNMPDYVAETTYRYCARKNPDSPLIFLKKSIKLVPNSLH